MSTITADPNMLHVLSQVKDITVIRDGDGNLVGIFSPTTSEERELYEKAKQLFDPAEIERRKREEGGKGVPLVEVWQRIHAKEAVK